MLATGVVVAEEEPFDYFRNSWNVIGLKDYTEGSRVTPQNEILLAGNRKLRMRFGRSLLPLSARQRKSVLDGWIPVISLNADDGHVRYEFTLWSTPLPTVKDWWKAFDWPTEGENFLNWIAVKVTNRGSGPAEARLKVERIGPTPEDPAMYSWKLPPGGNEEVVLRVPFEPVEDAGAFAKEDAGVWLDRTVTYWRGRLAKAARIEVPCRKASEALLAAHVCQMIASDHGELHGGEGFYDRFYIRDGAYQLMELEEAGLWDAAEKAARWYLTRQRDDGRFETQKGQLDANGQAPWVLWQYYKITGNKQWLAEAYPLMRRAVDWAAKARRAEPADSPYVGLLPPAIADGEYLWAGKNRILGYDFWNLRALLCTIDAASVLGKTGEAQQLAAEAKQYRAAIDASWKRLDMPHFPPSWEKDGTHWGNTETLWPTPIFERNDPRVCALVREVRDNHGGGFAEGTIRWLGTQDAVHPYMGAYTTMTCLAQGQHEQVVADFYWYLLHSTASHAFPEGLFFKRRFAWVNTIPHVTGASNYALMLRHMLVHESGDELHLLSAVPDWWLDEGKEIRVERAPTHFGVLSLTVRGKTEGVAIEFERPMRTPPARIVLHLPKSRSLLGELPGVEVVARSIQKQRWDFPTIVEAYRRQMPREARPIPGLITEQLRQALDPEKCDMLDLSAVANTDPLNRPFGKAGKPDGFTGMPVGRVVVDGIPFAVIDPAENDGRGLVVLHSPKSKESAAWPREVEIPATGRARRAFFLGNVQEWSPLDPGTGRWAGIAEYVIHYADGKTQIVPLVAGRTCDQWNWQPISDEVVATLEGATWHMNVLAASLRDVPIAKIVFRDLATASAPVLAAVTLER